MNPHNTSQKNCQFVIVFFKNIPQIGNKRQQISINSASLAQKKAAQRTAFV